MTHQFKPDWEKDQEYLAKVHWTLLAERKGATGLKVQLRELRSRRRGCSWGRRTDRPL